LGAIRGFGPAQCPAGPPLSEKRNRIMPIPIVLTAFGTTTKALQTYEYLDAAVRREFPGHEVHWAFSSRMVKDRLYQARRLNIRHPHQVLQDLQNRGYIWAVVQSLHLLAGHEFFRLLEEVASSPLRTSIGLPLLSAASDYWRLADALSSLADLPPGHALVLVGHGTDHPSWSAYPALESVLRRRYGHRVYVGVVEGYPGQEQVVDDLVKAGCRGVKLVPLMLVAGRHFLEDLTCGEDSWQAALAAVGLTVTVESGGLGQNEAVGQIFLDHIRAALETIPRGGDEAAAPLDFQGNAFLREQDSRPTVDGDGPGLGYDE